MTGFDRNSTHVLHGNGIIVDLRSRGAKYHNTTVRGTLDNVVSHDTVPTANADAVRPLLEGIGACRTNIVVLYRDVVATQVALGNVQTRPAAWVPRTDVLDQLAGIRTAKLDVCSAACRWCGSTSAVYLLEKEILCVMKHNAHVESLPGHDAA